MADADGAHLPAFDDVLSAAARLAGHARRTPLLAGTPLDESTGGRILLKLETLQHTGSFKFRGAYNRLAQIPADRRGAGVVAFSSGNHAQGVAAAARLLGIPATIVMPADAPRVKMRNTLAPGRRSRRIRSPARKPRVDRGTDSPGQRGAVLVPSFDDPDIIAGQGTVGLEIAEQAAEAAATLDDVVVCTSGGGLVAGTALAVRALSPATRIWTRGACRPRRSPPLAGVGAARIERARHALDLRCAAGSGAGLADVRDQPAAARGRAGRHGRRGACRHRLRGAHAEAGRRARWRRGARGQS